MVVSSLVSLRNFSPKQKFLNRNLIKSEKHNILEKSKTNSKGFKTTIVFLLVVSILLAVGIPAVALNPKKQAHSETVLENNMNTFAIKGNICYSKNAEEVLCLEHSYLVCEEGKCAGVFGELPEKYRGVPVTDYGDQLIIPGMTDLHIHAPQFSFRALGMDKELMDWLNAYTFKEESKYKDLEYAEKAYSVFVEHVRRSATTRLCVFGTIHREATLLLMDKLEQSGLIAYVGKVNMDRNSPDYLCESTEESVAETLQWLKDTEGRYERVKPIITPRFVPSCTNELMTELGHIAEKNNLPVQSHLSENLSEIAFVKELVPEAKTYGDAYDLFGLFGKPKSREAKEPETLPCIMAHCVHSSDEELQLIKQNGVYIAHSPESNINLCSGVAPVSKYLDMGLNVGLATDVAGGSSECMFKAIAHAVQASDLRWRLQDQNVKPLSFANAFYLATRGGGSFFGKVGAFDEGYEFDALVVSDEDLETPRSLSLIERLQRLPYLADYRNIKAKYVAGKLL